MRLLVACRHCHRQYDAAGRRVGSRFRCHCGQVLTIARPQGHDARVVRCSSCGAAREGGGLSCGHCGADYTLHERDLDTVCPECLGRVSDRARFCHGCGVGLTPELDAGSETRTQCPACVAAGPALTSRRIGAEGVTVLECGRCAGMWLGLEAFRQLADRARTSAVACATHRAAGRAGGELAPRQTGPLYRPCIVCRALMNRRHYGQRSGVVLDICHDHGVWFDSDELARILAWLRDGGGPEQLQEGLEPPRAGRRHRPAAESLPAGDPATQQGALVLGRWEPACGNPLLEALRAFFDGFELGREG